MHNTFVNMARMRKPQPLRLFSQVKEKCLKKATFRIGCEERITVWDTGEVEGGHSSDRTGFKCRERHTTQLTFIILVLLNGGQREYKHILGIL